MLYLNNLMTSTKTKNCQCKVLLPTVLLFEFLFISQKSVTEKCSFVCLINLISSLFTHRRGQNKDGNKNSK